MDPNFSGKVALITGGSRGIGRSIAESLAIKGAQTAICARGEDTLRQAGEEIEEKTSRRCFPIASDLSTEAGCKHFVSTAVAELGRADILVCCANHISDSEGSFENLTDENWVSHMFVKFFSAVRCTREVLPYMKESNWGRILFIAGMATRVVRPRAVDNGPVCAALTNFGKQLSAEVASRGIRVNSIHPNFTKTDLLTTYLSREASARGISHDDVVQELKRSMPIGRLIDAEEIASMVVYLCSDSADSVTGQSIAMDGGMSMGVHY